MKITISQLELEWTGAAPPHVLAAVGALLGAAGASAPARRAPERSVQTADSVDVDLLGHWINGKCERTAAARCANVDLFASYCDFVNAAGRASIGIRLFNSVLTQLGFEMTMHAGHRVRRGIRLK